MDGGNAGGELPAGGHAHAPGGAAQAHAAGPVGSDLIRAMAQAAQQEGIRVEPGDDRAAVAVSFGYVAPDATGPRMASRINANGYMLEKMATQVAANGNAVSSFATMVFDKLEMLPGCFNAIEDRMTGKVTGKLAVEVAKEVAKEGVRADARMDKLFKDFAASLDYKLRRLAGHLKRRIGRGDRSRERSRSRSLSPGLSSPSYHPTPSNSGYSTPGGDDGPGRDGDAIMRDAPRASAAAAVAGAGAAAVADTAAGGAACTAGGAVVVLAAAPPANGVAAAGAGDAGKRGRGHAGAPPGYAYVEIDGKPKQLLHMESGRIVTLATVGADRGNAQAGRGGYSRGNGGGRGGRGGGRSSHLQGYQGNQGYQSNQGSEPGPSGLNGGDPRDMICRTCGGRGHKAAQCPSGGNDGKKQRR